MIQTALHMFLDKIYVRLEETERLKDIIKNENKEHRAQTELLISENNNLKEGMINLLIVYGADTSLDSKLEADIFNNIKTLLESLG